MTKRATKNVERRTKKRATKKRGELPWFDPEKARERLDKRGDAGATKAATAAAESVRSFHEQIIQATTQFPEEWGAMRTHGGSDFIKKAASLIRHERGGSNCYLLAKRDNPNELCEDGLGFQDDKGPIVDVETGKHFRFIGVVRAAGSSDAAPVWQDLSGTTPSRALMVRPKVARDDGSE